MYKLTLLSLLISFQLSAQVMPVGTVILGKRLPTVKAIDTLNDNNNVATLYGSIKINDSKLSIVENGFVVLTNSVTRIPDVSNASKYIVAGGIADFKMTINNFASHTAYKYRAYAKNSRGEYAYSQINYFTTNTNYCEVNPCKNGATCASFASGPLCTCTVSFCGDCCAQLADSSCPGGGDQVCTITSVKLQNPKLKIIRINESLALNNIWNNNQVLTKTSLK